MTTIETQFEDDSRFKSLCESMQFVYTLLSTVSLILIGLKSQGEAWGYAFLKISLILYQLNSGVTMTFICLETTIPIRRGFDT